MMGRSRRGVLGPGAASVIAFPRRSAPADGAGLRSGNEPDSPPALPGRAVRSNWPGMARATPQSTAVADAEETIAGALSEAPKPIRPVGGA